MNLEWNKPIASTSPLFYLPPAMWAMGTLSYMGCHVIKYFIFPAAIATPMGCAGGAMIACPVAAVCAFMAGSGADMLHKSFAKPTLYATFTAVCLFTTYNLSLTISKLAVLTTGFIALAALALSIGLHLLLNREWSPSIPMHAPINDV